MAPSSIRDVTDATFQVDVLERSRTVPVLVDFWAEWCGPCKTLGPVLEKLAEEYGGAFELAKVDVDKNPGLAQAFQVQSIPAVKLVVDGRLVDQFDGALPEQALRQFLGHYLGEAGTPAGEEDPVEHARALARAGQPDAALQLLDALLAEPRVDGAGDTKVVDGAALLGAELAAERGDEERARAYLAQLSTDAAASAEARAVEARLALGTLAPGELERLEAAWRAAPGDADAHIAYGRALARAGRHEPALELLLEAVRQHREHDDQAARRAMLEVFDLLGADHDLVVDFRRQLQMALFV